MNEHDTILETVNEVFEDEGHGDVMGYYARGHVDHQKLLQAMAEQYSDSFENRTPRHLWLRKVPIHDGDGWRLIPSKKPGRGAFPATYVGEPLS